MKKYTVVALSLAVFLMTSGCSKDDDNSSDSASSDTTQETKYEGVWDATDPLYPLDIITNTINGKTFSKLVTYVDINSTSQINGSGSFSIDGTKKVQPNDKTVEKITYSISTCNATLTPLTVKTTNKLNTKNECGGGWTVNVAKDTSNCKLQEDTKTQCEYIKGNGKTIFHLDGNKIYLGNDNTTGSDDYPEALGTDFWTKK